jgi:hypothetical protein
MMAMSKRLRYEILRRDNHTCRYCGASAPTATLTIDHVTPVTLGGTDDPENLVTACTDCNSGKTSTAPDAPLVADVRQIDLKWKSAIERAAEAMAAERQKVDAYIDAFLHDWDKYGRSPWLPRDFASSLESMHNAGLPIEDMREAVDTALLARNVDSRFRYFCGICWKRVTRMQEIAKAILEADQVDGGQVS